MKRLLPFIFTLLMFFNSCKPVEEKVTKEEAVKFAAMISAGAKKRQMDFLSTNLIFPALIDRMEKEKAISINGDVRNGITKGLKKNDFEKSLFTMMGKKGSFETVKIYEKGGMQRVIFRAYGEGINYLDMELTKLDDKVGIADMYIYLTGENISTSMGELYNKLMAIPSGAAEESIAERMNLVKQLMAKNNYKQAKREFDRLPASVQTSRVAAVIKLQIISNLADTIYADELKSYEKKFAGEPNIQLAMIDMYLLNENYDKALGAIDQVDSIINKDPFLDYYRGLINYNKGDTDKAIEYYEKVVANNPTFAGAYEELFVLYLDKDKEKAKKYYKTFKRLDVAGTDLSSFETSYPFLKE